MYKQYTNAINNISSSLIGTRIVKKYWHRYKWETGTVFPFRAYENIYNFLIDYLL